MGLSDDAPPTSTPRQCGEETFERAESEDQCCRSTLGLKRLSWGTSPIQRISEKEKDMEADERGAAGNHSLGGKRIKVAVGEGWHGYLYPHFRSAAVILQSVCETFLHSWQRGSHPNHSGSISHHDDVIIRGRVGQLFIAEVGDAGRQSGLPSAS